MNKLLLKGAGVLGVVTVLALGVAITKNYMIDPAKNLATPLPATGSGTQYKSGCMFVSACNYDKTAKVQGDCNFAQYTTSPANFAPIDAPSLQMFGNKKPSFNIPPLSKICNDTSCEKEVFIRLFTINAQGVKIKDTLRSGGFTSDEISQIYNGSNACGDPSLKNNTAK